MGQGAPCEPRTDSRGPLPSVVGAVRRLAQGAGGSGRERGAAMAAIGPADGDEADGWNGTKLCLWAERKSRSGVRCANARR
ncbi:hypothetical protein SAMN05216360_111212 [Methylobacterium phyllostachyos]|uniref:Uncharacterized protein n=1 Tax=Methylobacterium phyllostachyos TaxID=582672 RepID=A0A1H0EK57_9HYPH|nr:hypothetical protein SAMN05216360_111212 [Methylobacterium phyllostachyos]